MNEILYELGYEVDRKEDKFYNDIYMYYYKKGFIPIILSQITEILSLFFGISLSFFILFCVDWNNLLKCNTDCGDLFSYVNLKEPDLISLLLFMTISSYTLYKMCFHVYNLRNLLVVRNYYLHILNISAQDLCTIEWKHVVYKISKIENLTMYEITNKILRKENYFIALFDKEIINIHPLYYSNHLDSCVRYIILENIDEISIRSLRQKFILYGLLNLIFCVPILIFYILHFFASNIDDFYSNKNVLGHRRYSAFAKRKFRNYNELEHFFEERLNKSIKYSLEYIKQFPSPSTEILGKFLGLVFGSFVGLFLILSLINEDILLHLKVFDRTLLFYTAIVGGVSAFARSLVRSPEESIYNPQSIMEKVVKYTNYMPSRWIGKCNTYKVRNEYITLFPYIFVLFLYDLLGVLISPYILAFVLSRESVNIVNFIKINSIGNNCVFSQNRRDIQDEKMSNSITIFDDNHSF
jgi:autophagy-related protein 9